MAKRKFIFIPVPPEPWGARLRRVREDIAHMNLDAAATAASEWTLTSTSTISRLEHYEELPEQRRTRMTAAMLCIIYRVDPAEFGLEMDDIPAMVRNNFNLTNSNGI